MELTSEQRDLIIEAITKGAMNITNGWLFELLENVIPQGLEGWPADELLAEAQRAGVDLEEILEDEEEK